MDFEGIGIDREAGLAGLTGLLGVAGMSVTMGDKGDALAGDIDWRRGTRDIKSSFAPTGFTRLVDELVVGERRGLGFNCGGSSVVLSSAGGKDVPVGDSAGKRERTGEGVADLKTAGLVVTSGASFDLLLAFKPS